MGSRLLTKRRAAGGPSLTIHELALHGPVPAANLPALCERVRALLKERPAAWVDCDLQALPFADLDTVELLARLGLTAQRGGSRIRVRHAPDGLRELLSLLGLDSCVSLSVEAGGQPEQREEAGRVQEERDPADPTV
jgi:ABC-type transporter Mla MlaB component